MNQLIFMIIVGSLVSISGTSIGALIGLIFKNPSKRTLGYLIGFAGGIMLSVVMLDLIPEALESWGSINTVIFCTLGIVIITFIDSFMQKRNKINKHTKMALITAVGLMIHNFPEGIIMGCGFASGSVLGIKMSLIVAIHDIPEGIAVSAPLMLSKAKGIKIFLYTVLTAIPTVFGTFAGAYIGKVSPNAMGISLSIASGIMLYVICGEMIPESSKLWEGIASTIGVLTGIICGLIIINVL